MKDLDKILGVGGTAALAKLLKADPVERACIVKAIQPHVTATPPKPTKQTKSPSK